MHAKDRNGFTILEILIALSILATVLSIVFTSYTATFRIIGETESQAEIYQMARIALERIIEDLACTLPETSGDFSGEDEEIDGRSADSMCFTSWAHLVFSDQDQPWGAAEISYYVEQDEEEEEGLVLYRSDTPRLDKEPAEEGLCKKERGFPLCKKLVSVDFTYRADDWEDLDDWEEEGIPRLVSVSLEFINPSNPEAPLKFATSVAVRTGTVKKDKG